MCGASSQTARNWHDCQCDQLQCGHLSVQEGMAVAAGIGTASQDVQVWHDCPCDQLQYEHLSVQWSRCKARCKLEVHE